MVEYEVIVSGGGIGGLATAIGLRQRDVSTLLITDPITEPTQGNFGLDLRTLALSPVSANWLYELGLAQTTPCQRIESMRVWEARGATCIDFDATSVGTNALAWTYEHQSLVTELFTQCTKNLDVRTDSKISKIDDNQRSVTMNNRETIACKLLVIAEGAQSFSRKMLGVPWHRHDLKQRAIVTLARLVEGHKNIALQRFGNGVCALLPMKDADVVSVIWSVPEKCVQELVNLSDENFKIRLESQFASICGKFTAVDRRASFPLEQSLADQFLPREWIVLLGDSAHTLHPLAGQGVNLGLEDARQLIAVLKGGFNSALIQPLLRHYARRRRVRAQLLQRAMTFFDATWSWGSPTTRWVRNSGTRFFNNCEFLKEQVIREAMGIGPLAKIR